MLGSLIASLRRERLQHRWCGQTEQNAGTGTAGLQVPGICSGKPVDTPPDLPTGAGSRGGMRWPLDVPGSDTNVQGRTVLPALQGKPLLISNWWCFFTHFSSAWTTDLGTEHASPEKQSLVLKRTVGQRKWGHSASVTQARVRPRHRHSLTCALTVCQLPQVNRAGLHKKIALLNTGFLLT